MERKGFTKNSKHSEETKRLMSEKRKLFYSKGGKHPRLGVKYSKELCEKLSKAHMGHIASAETRKKLSDLRKGSNHWNYKHDRNTLSKKQERNDSAYREWRLSVYKRDKYLCRLQSDTCSGRIEAHHILVWKDYPNLRYEISNGITLCHAHHPKVRSEEKRLVPVFQELVSVSKKPIWL